MSNQNSRTDTSAMSSKDIMAANAAAIQFDTAVAHRILKTMGKADTAGKATKQDRDNASLDFVRFAALVVAANESVERSTVTLGFVKHLDSMRPSLAKDGSPFVEVIAEDGKDTRFVWQGHGNNVKSIAKGVTEFIGLEIDGEPVIINPADAESFTEVKKSVEAARRAGEDDDAILLRNAKDALRQNCKELIAEVIKSDDYDLISCEADEVALLLVDWNTALALQNEANAVAATKVVIPAEAQSEAA